MRFIAAILLLNLVAQPAMARKPVKGTATLTASVPFASALEVDGYVPSGDWWVELKVTKIVTEGFEFETTYFESPDHPDFTGKPGKFLIRLPEKATLPVAVDEIWTIRTTQSLPPCVENTWALIKDDRVNAGYYERVADGLSPLRLTPDPDDTTVSVAATALNAKAEEQEKTEFYTRFRMPQELKSTPEGEQASVAVADIGTKSALIKAGGKNYRYFVVESRRDDLTEKGKKELTCKKSFTRQSVIWLAP